MLTVLLGYVFQFIVLSSEKDEGEQGGSLPCWGQRHLVGGGVCITGLFICYSSDAVSSGALQTHERWPPKLGSFWRLRTHLPAYLLYAN
jgi:hypothetical protein